MSHRLRAVFLSALGLIYAAAFVSLWVQIDGLVGSGGILPVGESMEYLREQRHGFLGWPTLFWFGESDAMLHGVCAAGVVASLLVAAGFLRLPALGVAWFCYLSLFRIGWDFLGFQWDLLLLETGFVSLFVATRAVFPWHERRYPVSLAATWLLRFLFFRLMLASGLVKLLSGDELWRDLTALTVHYETQPLPTWLAWHAHQLPAWCQRVCCAIMFAIELVAPVLVFCGRRARWIAAAAGALLQVLIFATGNYGFFNLLALALCVPLLDGARDEERPPVRWLVYGRAVAMSALACFATFLFVRGLLNVQGEMGTPWAQIDRWRIAGHYGLFARMTKKRYEIVIEGSETGLEWKAYEFRYKPGDPKAAPAFCQPHLPRLDWLMWFEAIPPWRHSVWFRQFFVKLHDGAPEVRALLAHDPFPDEPPRFLRATLHRYTFTDRAERSKNGTWWKREFTTLYVSPRAR